MRETVKVFNGKEVTCKYYSKKQIREFVSEIEKEELCTTEASERYSVTTETVRQWLQRYSKIIDVRIKHRHSEETKKTAVRDVQAGILTLDEAAKKYDVYKQSIQSWMAKYSILIPAHKIESIQDSASEQKIAKTSLKEIEELKLKVIALETMIDVAEKELNIDIRKKSGTKRSL
ncbi:MAG: hypothetical protein HC831_22935 [Chloroflexia bacterium]|nr:hypothetical protein [Chloroflexia bacterium]